MFIIFQSKAGEAEIRAACSQAEEELRGSSYLRPTLEGGEGGVPLTFRTATSGWDYTVHSGAEAACKAAGVPLVGVSPEKGNVWVYRGPAKLFRQAEFLPELGEVEILAVSGHYGRRQGTLALQNYLEAQALWEEYSQKCLGSWGLRAARSFEGLFAPEKGEGWWRPPFLTEEGPFWAHVQASIAAADRPQAA